MGLASNGRATGIEEARPFSRRSSFRMGESLSLGSLANSALTWRGVIRGSVLIMIEEIKRGPHVCE